MKDTSQCVGSRGAIALHEEVALSRVDGMRAGAMSLLAFDYSAS